MSASVVPLLPTVGPFDVIELREAAAALREVGGAFEKLCELEDSDPENIALAIRFLRSAVRELRAALAPYAQTHETASGRTPKRPTIYMSERLAQDGRAITLYTIEYDDGAPADALVLYQQGALSPGGSSIRVLEAYQGADTKPSPVERALESYRRQESHLLGVKG